MEAAIGVLVVLVFFAADRARLLGAGPARVRARRDLPARPPDRPEGARPDPADPDHRPHGQGRPADGHPQHPAAGGDHPRQRPSPRQRGRLLPGHRPEQGDRRGRELPARHLADLADGAALGARQGRARPAALRARAAQRGAAEDHRRADRALGREGDRRSRSRTSRSPSRCSGRWRARPRPSASGGRRSSTPRASSRRPQKLTDAADIISTNPASLQLRYLQTLLEIGSNQNTTVVFPLPMDMLEASLSEERSTAVAPDELGQLSPTRAEIEAAQRLRLRVFVEEQGVAREPELDGLDAEAVHDRRPATAMSIVATCRLRFARRRLQAGTDGGRVRAPRRSGVGAELLARPRTRRGDRARPKCSLNAQLRARAFYERGGYAALERGDRPRRRDRARPDEEVAAREPPPEIRIDQLTGLRTILAPGAGRRARTSSAAERPQPKAPESCPFCEGHEDRTPPEVYATRPGRRRARHARAGRRGSVPNLYPALGRGADERRRRRAPTPSGAFASRGDPLLASRAAGEPDLFSSRPATAPTR